MMKVEVRGTLYLYQSSIGIWLSLMSTQAIARRRPAFVEEIDWQDQYVWAQDHLHLILLIVPIPMIGGTVEFP